MTIVRELGYAPLHGEGVSLANPLETVLWNATPTGFQGQPPGHGAAAIFLSHEA